MTWRRKIDEEINRMGISWKVANELSRNGVNGGASRRPVFRIGVQDTAASCLQGEMGGKWNVTRVYCLGVGLLIN
jgi:hypothetical protein